MMKNTADLEARRQEAILRAKQMHLKAKKGAPPPVITLPEVMQNDPAKKPSKGIPNSSPIQNHKEQENLSPIDYAKSFLKKMGLDLDTVIILIVLYFLIDEAADKTIIFALIYLLL